MRDRGKRGEESKEVMEAWSRKKSEGCQETGAGSPVVEEDFCWAVGRWSKVGSEEAGILCG